MEILPHLGGNNNPSLTLSRKNSDRLLSQEKFDLKSTIWLLVSRNMGSRKTSVSYYPCLCGPF